VKQLNFTINDAVHAKLEAIKSAKGVNNNAEAIEFLIEEVFKQLQTEKAKAKAVKLGVQGSELR